MEIYIFVIFLILTGMLLRYKQKKIYCIYVGIILLLLIGLRDKSMGIVDTQYIYIPTFNKILNTPFFEINNFFSKDIVFIYITKIYTYLSSNQQLWLFLLGIPIILGISMLIYRESKNPVLSFILFLSLNYYRNEFYAFKTIFSIRNYNLFL